MTHLEHDAAGFLVGKLVGVNNQILDAQQASFGTLKGIRRDVSAIARALNVQVKAQARSTTSGRGGQRTQRIAPATTASRGSRTVGGNAVGTRTVAQAAAKVTKAVAAVALAGAGRDAKGRFTKAATRGRQGADDNGEADAGIPSESTSRGLLGKIAGGIGQLNANRGAADNIDPTVNAMKEVTDVVSPLGRGLSFMFGRTAERRKERWYMRIIKAIQTPITKKGQEAVPVGRSGSPIVRMLGTLFGGPLGKLGAVFAAIPSLLMGVLSRIFLPLAAIWGAWELGKWIGEKIYAWFDDSDWNQKLFDAVDWLRDTFSNAWKAVGDGIDTVVGMIEGAWKTITDGFKSALDAFMECPTKIGEFFSGLDEAMRKLPVVGKAYAAAADAIKSTADDAKRGYEEGKSGATDKPAQTATQAIARDAGKAVAAAQEVGSQARAGPPRRAAGRPLPAPRAASCRRSRAARARQPARSRTGCSARRASATNRAARARARSQPASVIAAARATGRISSP